MLGRFGLRRRLAMNGLSPSIINGKKHESGFEHSGDESHPRLLAALNPFSFSSLVEARVLPEVERDGHHTTRAIQRCCRRAGSERRSGAGDAVAVGTSSSS